MMNVDKLTVVEKLISGNNIRILLLTSCGKKL